MAKLPFDVNTVCKRDGRFMFPSGNFLLFQRRLSARNSRTVIWLLTLGSKADNITVRELRGCMAYSAKEIGRTIRETRRRLGVTQKALALTSGTGLRFIIDLEKGKETAQACVTAVIDSNLARTGLSHIQCH